jgi:hypothetical protein
MPRKRKPRWFVATETGRLLDPDGNEAKIVTGETQADENDPLYKAFPYYFRPVEVAPGEKRGE